jgi:hypothetical protein
MFTSRSPVCCLRFRCVGRNWRRRIRHGELLGEAAKFEEQFGGGNEGGGGEEGGGLAVLAEERGEEQWRQDLDPILGREQ